MKQDFDHAVAILKQGGIIAYPTEAVYGLGCDPFNDQAIKKLLQIKQRDWQQGLIVIGANWSQLQPLTKVIPEHRLKSVLDSWPGPNTWIFPAADTVSKLVTGSHQSIAIRVTNHPIAISICELFQGPIVSTSANLHEQAAAQTAEDVERIFGEQIDLIISGKTGGLAKPSTIKDAMTGKVLRS